MKKIEDLRDDVLKLRESIETFARIEEELRAIRNGMPDERAKARMSDMLRANRDIVEITEKRLEVRKSELAKLEGR